MTAPARSPSAARSTIAILVPLFVGVLVSPAMAQRDTVGCPKADQRTCGEVWKVTPPEAKTLVRKLNQAADSGWQPVLRDYFGKLYNRDFLDWVIFLRKDGTSAQALLADGKLVEDNIVRGHQSLAVLVFSESPFTPTVAGARPDSAAIASQQQTDSIRLGTMARHCKAAGVACTVTLGYPGDETRPATGDNGGDATQTDGELSLRRATLQYTRDPGLIALLKGLTGSVIGLPADPQSVPDSAQLMKLDDVVMARPPGDTTRLYFGYRRMHLPLNSVVRFTLRPNREAKADFPGTTSISRTIENGSRNRFGASLGTGITFDAPDSTFTIADTGRSVIMTSSSSVKPRVWLMAHIAIARPLLPIRPQDFSLLFGTNLSTSDLFRDLLVGIGAGRLVGDVGLVTGLNFIQRQSATPQTGAGGRFVGLQTREYRKVKWFVGLDFAL